MKHLSLKRFTLLLSAFSFLLFTPASAQFSGGNGTGGNPYIITTPAQLDSVRYFPSAHFKLGNDIDLTGYLAPGGAGYAKWDTLGWLPLGDATTRFTGNFDGAGHIITGLKINHNSLNYVSLFGVVTGATIKNLGIKNCSVNGPGDSGGLAGYNSQSVIQNCYVTGSIIGNNYVGGLVGYSKQSTIQNCYVNGSISGKGNSCFSNVGGLAGYAGYSSAIQNCYAIGSVSGGGVGCNLGGLVAYIEESSIIQNCYVSNRVRENGSPRCSVGGLAGHIQTGSTIQNCVAANDSLIISVPYSYNGGDVNRIVGLVFDSLSTCTFHNNYFNNAMVVQAGGVSVIENNNAITAGSGKDINTFKTLVFYNTASNWYLQEWDINDPSGIWKICDGTTLPFLRWQQDDPCPALPPVPKFCGGDGTVGTPYLICTASQLDSVRYFLSKHFKLNNNIDLSDYLASGAGYTQWGSAGWLPLGNNTIPFSGSFDGSSFTISGLKINRSSANYVALFGAASGANIKNLGIKNCNIKGNDYVGGLVGSNSQSAIQNCYLTGSISGNNEVGGLTGQNTNVSTIQNCYATATVYGNSVGGLVAYNAQSVIKNCYATGSIYGINTVGGLAGSNYFSTIQNCVAAYDSLKASSSGANINRIAGLDISGNTYRNNYANSAMVVQINGVTVPKYPNPVNGADTTMATLKNLAFYNTASNWYLQAWDINNPSGIWKICNNISLPFLRWQADDPCPLPLQAFCGGDGTIADPYLICTASQLDSMRYFLSAHFKLKNNIDLTAYLASGGGYNQWGSAGWMPIGNNTTPFTGSLEGSSFTISGLKINRSSTNYVALFGAVSGANIKNMGIENCSITGYDYVGGLAGNNTNASIIQACYVSGTINGNNYAGGLAGSNSAATFQNCYSTANVNGNTTLGGLTGANSAAVIQYCYASGTISGANNVGGLAGSNYNSTIQNAVAANNSIKASSSGANANRIAGLDNGGNTYRSNYANSAMDVLINNLPQPININPVNGTSRDMTMLKTFSFYNTASNWYAAAWDINDPSGIWRICNNSGLPFLRWENRPPCPPQPFCGGDGSPSNPYLICTPAQLDSVRYFLSSHFKLNNTIDLAPYLAPGGAGFAQWANFGWLPIGTGINPFTGSLDGSSFTINGLKINRSNAPAGLFGGTNGSTIKNLGIKNCTLSGEIVGGLACQVSNSTIENCYATGNIKGSIAAGGLIGGSLQSTIQNSYANCRIVENNEITGDFQVGGLVGGVRSSTISYCYAAGNIRVDYRNILFQQLSIVGGLVGSLNENNIIQNCVAANDSIVVLNSFATTINVNRIAGADNGVNIFRNNYANMNMVVQINGATVPKGNDPTVNGTGETKATLRTLAFYNTASKWYNNMVWSIIDPSGIWKICDGKSLPFLRWENRACFGTLFCGGEGSPSDPLLVCTAEQLDAMRNDLTTHFKLSNNIDLTEYLTTGNGFAQWGSEGWEPIGNQTNPFSGNFDGNGFVVTGLQIDRSSAEETGLFGFTNNAVIKNIGIVNCSINGNEYVGGLAGHLYQSAVENSYATGFINGNSYVGGLAGVNNYSAIENSYAAGLINGLTAVGGLSGMNYANAVVRNSYAAGIINGVAAVGGLAGLHDNSLVGNSYASGFAMGDMGVGGVLGGNLGGLVLNAVAAQDRITGREWYVYLPDNVHRIAGIDNGGSYYNNFANNAMDIQISSNTVNMSDDATVNGTGKTVAELQSLNFFTTSGNWQAAAAWEIFTDNSRVWSIWDNKSYPYFSWQSAPVYNLQFTPYDISFELRNPADSVLVYSILTQEQVEKYTSLSSGVHTLSHNIASQGDILQVTVYEAGKKLSYPVMIWVEEASAPRKSPANTEKPNTPDEKITEECIITDFPVSENVPFNYEIEDKKPYENIISLGEKVTAYPNPVNRGQSLYIDADVDEELLRGAVINIYTISGHYLNQIKVQGRLTLVNINNYGTGVYLFVLHGKNGLRKDLKVMVQ